MESAPQTNSEPWLRGTLAEIPAVARAVLHALELAKEDVERWSAGLSDEELEVRPMGLPAVAFQMRHIARSLDRLLTYAENDELGVEQLAALRSEGGPIGTRAKLFEEFAKALTHGTVRVRALADRDLEQPRFVGKKRLPSSLGGLLVHVAEHTQRHLGQLVTTAKIVVATRSDKI
jgi:uncharacterized damage-inducible protein DinB